MLDDVAAAAAAATAAVEVEASDMGEMLEELFGETLEGVPAIELLDWEVRRPPKVPLELVEVSCWEFRDAAIDSRSTLRAEGSMLPAKIRPTRPKEVIL